MRRPIIGTMELSPTGARGGLGDHVFGAGATEMLVSGLAAVGLAPVGLAPVGLAAVGLTAVGLGVVGLAAVGLGA